ncbi:MAG: hypothetical protein Q8936_20655 [Bacillota bacterium]|nr:hypothetical protein [Bacillota bacterium]
MLPQDFAELNVEEVQEPRRKEYMTTRSGTETVGPLCELIGKNSTNIIVKVKSRAGQGLRVLESANGFSYEIKENIEQYNLIFKGLVAHKDTPKPSIRELINLCKKAKIRSIMITGEY